MLTSNIAGVENGVNKVSFRTRFVFACICLQSRQKTHRSPGVLMSFLQCQKQETIWFCCVPVQDILIQTRVILFNAIL